MNLEKYIANLFTDPQMLRMGHGQRLEDLNLGLGWIYYGLARALRPSQAVVIGSYRGFVPSVIARALLDNGEDGRVCFIDPSFADDFWTDPATVRDHFSKLGTANVVHHRHTTQDFIETEAFRSLENIGLLMVDGYHTAEQARLDYLSFLPKLDADAVTLFHDSVQIRESRFYGHDKKYYHTVREFIERLERTPGLDVMTLPLASGITLVRGKPESFDEIEKPFEEPVLIAAKA